MQLNGAQGHIYLSITFAVLIFMIKTIRHLWVACARALRLTMIVKRATIQGLHGCLFHLSALEHSLWWKCHYTEHSELLRGYDTDSVSKTSPMKAQRITGSVHIVLSLSFFFFFFTRFLFLLRRHIFDGGPSAPLITGWTALYSPCCLEGQSIL